MNKYFVLLVMVAFNLSPAFAEETKAGFVCSMKKEQKLLRGWTTKHEMMCTAKSRSSEDLKNAGSAPRDADFECMAQPGEGGETAFLKKMTFSQLPEKMRASLLRYEDSISGIYGNPADILIVYKPMGRSLLSLAEAYHGAQRDDKRLGKFEEVDMTCIHTTATTDHEDVDG